MIQKQSRLNISDNSGAREILCIRIIPGIKKIGTAGDLIVSVVKKALPSETISESMSQKANSLNTKTPIKKSEIVLAMIIRIKTFLSRDDGIFVAFDKNSAILLKSDKMPRASRIFGPVSKEVKKKNLIKINSLANQFI